MTCITANFYNTILNCSKIHCLSNSFNSISRKSSITNCRAGCHVVVVVVATSVYIFIMHVLKINNNHFVTEYKNII